MSLNKTDCSIYITQLRLVNLLYFQKWYVCYVNYYSMLHHNAKQCYLLFFKGLQWAK